RVQPEVGAPALAAGLGLGASGGLCGTAPGGHVGFGLDLQQDLLRGLPLYRKDGVRLGGSLALRVVVSGGAGQPRGDAAGRATVPGTDRDPRGQRPSPAVRAAKPRVGIKRQNHVSGLSGKTTCRATRSVDTGKPAPGRAVAATTHSA